MRSCVERLKGNNNSLRSLGQLQFEALDGKLNNSYRSLRQLGFSFSRTFGQVIILSTKSPPS